MGAILWGIWHVKVGGPTGCMSHADTETLTLTAHRDTTTYMRTKLPLEPRARASESAPTMRQSPSNANLPSPR